MYIVVDRTQAGSRAVCGALNRIQDGLTLHTQEDETEREGCQTANAVSFVKMCLPRFTFSDFVGIYLPPKQSPR